MASVTQKRGGEVIAQSSSTTPKQDEKVGAKSVNPSLMSVSEFLSKAKTLEAVIDGQRVVLDVKAFSTGSYGWNATGKLSITVDGKPVKCQLGVNLTVVGSKDAPR